MKKIFSFFMAVMLLVSAVPVAYAAETETSTETSNIEMVGKYSAATYEVTVPSKLAPGETGTVTATGAWASNQTLTVTCPNSVTLSYGNQTIDVGVTFAGINQVGDDLNEMNVSTDVTVANATAMFGTWTGTLTYNVELVTEEVAVVGSATFEDGVTLSWEELKLEENGIKYDYDASAITDTSIGNYAFYCCNSMESINIPESVTSIGEYAFDSASVLKKIDLSRCTNLTSIGESAFACTAITSINLPNSVKNISDYAFNCCILLDNVDLSHIKITSIGTQAFCGCESLTSINLPESVTSIGKLAFYHCISITSITFNGTMSQWNAITKTEDWNTDCSEIKVTCTDGTIIIPAYE